MADNRGCTKLARLFNTALKTTEISTYTELNLNQIIVVLNVFKVLHKFTNVEMCYLPLHSHEIMSPCSFLLVLFNLYYFYPNLHIGHGLYFLVLWPVVKIVKKLKFQFASHYVPYILCRHFLLNFYSQCLSASFNTLLITHIPYMSHHSWACSDPFAT